MKADSGQSARACACVQVGGLRVCGISRAYELHPFITAHTEAIVINLLQCSNVHNLT